MSLITRHNYEEYFILYLDNELSAADKQMVELFAAQNPDLKDELDLLMQSKLVPDANIVFEGKEVLLKNETDLPVTGITEKLLLHLDNELPAGDKADIEKLIAADTDVNKEWQLLQYTKLPAEAIVFPNKESLYRKEEKVRVVSIKWWRIAAAAVVLLGIGFGTYSILNKKGAVIDGSGAETAGKIKTITPEKADDPKIISPVIESPKEEIANTPENKTEQKPLIVKQNSNAPIIKDDKKNITVQPEQPLVVKNNIIDKKDELPLFEQNKEQKNNSTNANADVAINDKNNTSLQNIKKEDVTTENPPRNTNTQAGDNPEVSRPVIVMSEPENSGKKNKLRGFFRKATRVFERTTNISATDNDDRLLIGALAVRLK